MKAKILIGVIKCDERNRFYLRLSMLAAPTSTVSGSSYAAVSNLQDSLAQKADSVLGSCGNPDVFCGAA